MRLIQLNGICSKGGKGREGPAKANSHEGDDGLIPRRKRVDFVGCLA